MGLTPKGSNPRSLAVAVGTFALLGVFVPRAHADVVTEWNTNLLTAVRNGGTNPLVSTRVAAMVAAAVFDAVNGVERRYTPVHVTPDAPAGASQRAAAIQAAHDVLVALYPLQQADLDSKQQISLAAIASGAAADDSVSVARGTEWGHAVAMAILAWRATDGFTPAPPPFTGVSAIGVWRATPPAYAPMAAPQFATMTPWAIVSPSQFRPAGPPALASSRYAADFNETITMGGRTTTSPTPEQVVATFWNGNTPLYWNRILHQVSEAYHLTLSDNARLFALLNLAMADAAIACWDAKWQFQFWRPVTAVAFADQDGNPDTDLNTSWTPWLVTPAHPEYPSGHSTVSGAAAAILADYFGDATSFTIDSETAPGAIRSFDSFSAALHEIHNARVWGGIHFRSACVDGSAVGEAVAVFIREHAMLSVHGERIGQLAR